MAKKLRITSKQKSARRKNIAVARKSKKKAGVTSTKELKTEMAGINKQLKGWKGPKAKGSKTAFMKLVNRKLTIENQLSVRKAKKKKAVSDFRKKTNFLTPHIK